MKATKILLTLFVGGVFGCNDVKPVAEAKPETTVKEQSPSKSSEVAQAESPAAGTNAKKREYHKLHKDEVNARKAKQYKANRDRILDTHGEYWEKNKGWLNAKRRIKYQENKKKEKKN